LTYRKRVAACIALCIGGGTADELKIGEVGDIWSASTMDDQRRFDWLETHHEVEVSKSSVALDIGRLSTACQKSDRSASGHPSGRL
jgi:hypothetical protein